MRVQEFHRCLLYMVTKASIHEMENGSGIEIFKNEPYERDGIIGRFTDKRFHLAKYVGTCVIVYNNSGTCRPGYSLF